MDGVIMMGTRNLQTLRKEHPFGTSYTRSFTRDKGMTKNVTASVTFVGGGTNQLQAANGTFTGFVAGDPVLVEGANLNNGEFITTAIDTVNASFLTVDPPPKAEGPLTVTVRTP